MKNIFGAQIVQQHEKYLGLPPMVGRGKKNAFNRIKDQVSRKMAGWKGKLLSNAGREVLIKAVAQATPTYTMNCFKLPDSLCSEINSLVRGFWWGKKESARKIAWVLWENLCKPKKEGGMGFRDLKAFNLALLAKQGWRIQQRPGSLIHRVLKAKYFAKTSFLDAQVRKKPSYIWRSLMAAKLVLRDGVRWCVGDGKSIKIWKDAWLTSTMSGRIISPRPTMEIGESVANLIAHDKAEWKGDLVRSIFLPFEAETILSIPISTMNPVDSQVWAYNPNGIFSIKSAYKVAVRYLEASKRSDGRLGCSDTSKIETIWKLVWSLKCPNKVKHFL